MGHELGGSPAKMSSPVTGSQYWKRVLLKEVKFSSDPEARDPDSESASQVATRSRNL